jgi:reactive intermediate/imine deaminase
MRTTILLFAAAVSTTAAAQQPTDTTRAQKQVIQLPGSLPGLPFSSAVRVGGVLYLSGQIGVLPSTRQLVDTGVVKQTQQTLENIKTVLSYAGSSLDRVFKCTVFLVNIADFEKMNGVYATYFPKDPPARSTVAGSGLALGARVEIECLATVGG